MSTSGTPARVPVTTRVDLQTTGSSSRLAEARLEELLGVVRGRVDEALTTKNRLRSLLEAVTAVGADLEMRGVLQRIIDSACRLVDARYGALAIAGSSHQITEIVTSGVSPEDAARIGALPVGEGVLSMLVQDLAPRRIANVTEHPAFLGFPKHHPVITTLLGVPIHHRGELFGTLYLGNKKGGVEFSNEDEEVAAGLATAAAIAIQNARMFERERRRQRWRLATAEIITLLVGEVDRGDALRLVARRVRELTDAEFVSVSLEYDYEQDQEQDLLLEVVDGLGMEGAAGQHVQRTGIVGSVVESGQRLLIDDLMNDDRVNVPPESPWATRIAVIGPTVAVPLTTPDGVVGVLTVGWRRDISPPPDIGNEVLLIETLAAQAALALQRVQGQEERRRLLLMEERDRIASDLLDVAVRRLSSIGMDLQTANTLERRREVRTNVDEVVKVLDQSIRDLGGVVFASRQGRRT